MFRILLFLLKFYFSTLLRQCTNSENSVASASLILFEALCSFHGAELINRHSTVTICGILCQCLESQVLEYIFDIIVLIYLEFKLKQLKAYLHFASN